MLTLRMADPVPSLWDNPALKMARRAKNLYHSAYCWNSSSSGGILRDGAALVKPVVIGHSWPDRPAVSPAVVSAIEMPNRPRNLRPRALHSLWALDYSFTFLGRYRVASKSSPWLERPPGLARLVPPRTPYWEDTEEAGARLHTAYIKFTGGEIAGLQQLTTTEQGHARIHDTDGLLGKLLQNIAAIAQQYESVGFWKAQAKFFDILDTLVHCEETPENEYRVLPLSKRAAESRFVRDIKRYMQEHLHEKVTLKDLAAHVHVSLSQLSHRYRHEMDETPMVTLHKMRIDLVKMLLINGESLKFIADETGFTDIYHLSKSFKRSEGASPRNFLKARNLEGQI